MTLGLGSVSLGAQVRPGFLTAVHRKDDASPHSGTKGYNRKVEIVSLMDAVCVEPPFYFMS